jgi:hypothetical protein
VGRELAAPAPSVGRIVLTGRSSPAPDDRAPWIRDVRAEISAPHGADEVLTERRMRGGDAVERRLQPLRDCETGALDEGLLDLGSRRQPPAGRRSAGLKRNHVDTLAWALEERGQITEAFRIPQPNHAPFEGDRPVVAREVKNAVRRPCRRQWLAPAAPLEALARGLVRELGEGRG